MTRSVHLRAAAAALAAAFSGPALAHELACEATVGLARLDAAGNPVLGADGLPAFAAGPSPILAVDAYPAAIGFRVVVRNVAPATSVVSEAEDPLLDPLGAAVTRFGAPLEAGGLALPVGEEAAAVRLVRVGSPEECRTLLGAGAGGDGPTCGAVVEDRFVVRHESGSAECRAQLLCRAATPPPPPRCGGRGEPCCEDDACRPGLACAEGVCRPPKHACGGEGEACCDHGRCHHGLTCAGHVCGRRPPPAPRPPHDRCDDDGEGCCARGHDCDDGCRCEVGACGEDGKERRRRGS